MPLNAHMVMPDGATFRLEGDITFHAAAKWNREFPQVPVVAPIVEPAAPTHTWQPVPSDEPLPVLLEEDIDERQAWVRPVSGHFGSNRMRVAKAHLTPIDDEALLAPEERRDLGHWEAGIISNALIEAMDRLPMHYISERTLLAEVQRQFFNGDNLVSIVTREIQA